MFKIYDLNYNEVNFPIDKLGYGMKTPGNIGFDIQIGSIIYENIYHQSSYTDKLIKRYPKNRDVNIVLSVVGMDETDLRLKRDEVYAFFRQLGVFYIAEEAQPFKLLKVTIDAGYNIEELNAVWGRAEIPLKVVDTPFKQSLHTTLDIDQEGIQFNDKWAYGMGTLTEEESRRYSFDESDSKIVSNTNLVSNSRTAWEEGGIWTTGNESPEYDRIRMSESISISKGETYTLSDDSLYTSAIESIRLFVYDSGELVLYKSIDRKSAFTFTAPGDTLRISVVPMKDFSVPLYFLEHPENRIRIKVEVGEEATPWNVSGQETKRIVFFNAGTADLKLIQQKESLIELKAKEDSDWFEIVDHNGNLFRLNRPVDNGDTVRIRGDSITLNGINAIADTNYGFLTVSEGNNEWDIRGISKYEVKLDFRFLYD